MTGKDGTDTGATGNGASTSMWPDLRRDVFFSGYPNYPPQLTRLTRRKLEDVLANLSFLALLSATLSLDEPQPASLCFETLVARGCLPTTVCVTVYKCLGVKTSKCDCSLFWLCKYHMMFIFTQQYATSAVANMSAAAKPTRTTQYPQSNQPNIDQFDPAGLRHNPSPSSGVRINMGNLVFPQLMFEVWVNLPIVFCESVLRKKVCRLVDWGRVYKAKVRALA